MLSAIEAGVTVVEYTPAEVKRAVVGYGRAEKPQVQQMVKLLLGLDRAPEPHDAADALAVAICHLHSMGPISKRALGAGSPRGAGRASGAGLQPGQPRSWRQYKPA
jgi:crossover junction endodeoxyribonuclease RuvC